MESGEISKAELRVLAGPAQFQIEYVLEHNRALLHAAQAGLVAAKLTLLDAQDQIRRLRRRLGESWGAGQLRRELTQLCPVRPGCPHLP